MNDELKIKIVPELRFPEFEGDGEWKQVYLGKIGKPLMCKRIFKEQTSANSENAIPFYKIGTFGGKSDAFIPIDLYNDFKSKYSFPKIGDILISASGTIGRLVVYDGADAYFQDSNIVWIDNDETQITNSLLFYCYSNLVWQTSDGGIIKRLYNSDLKEMEICFPKNPKEQQKIANCLSSLDNLITAETEKLDYLKDHKKGLLQQLFPANGETKPQFRFPEFKNDGDWEEVELGNYCFITTGKLDANAMVKKGKYRFYTCARNFYRIDDFAFDTEALLVSGNGANVGYIHYYKGKFNAYQRTYVLDQFRMNIHYLKYNLEYNLSKRISSEKKEGNTPYIVKSTLSEMKIILPNNKEEQKKIANCLSSADDLIEAQTTKIEALKKHKKGLMQQLFPNINNVIK